MNLNDKISLAEIISQCMETRDIVKRIKLLEKLNGMLTIECKIKLPTLVTNNYLDKKLNLLEEKLFT